MNRVLEHIEQIRQRIKQFPFLAFVQDKSIEPKDRLGFTPCLAPMAMGFSDLMVLGMREVPTSDPAQKILNLHTEVDDRHWQFFVNDLQALGINKSLTLSDTLKLLWGEHCAHARRLIYRTMAMVRGEQNAVMRLVILEVIEVAADEGFRPFREVGVEFTKKTGIPLLYFGQPHQDLENEHEAMGDTSIRSMIESYPWTEAELARALQYADEVAELFRNFGEELKAYAERALKEGPFWPLNPAPAKSPSAPAA